MQLGKYRHYKGMNYIVHGVVRHSETLEQLVYYECLYDNPDGKFWVRPKEMFEGTLMLDGKEVKRFTYLGE